MDKYLKKNLDHWNEVTPIHARSPFYDLAGFKSGKTALRPIELEELGDVKGKSLLHLQCHFGMDTLSWARLGAKVTGVDFSGEAIPLARSLASEMGIDAAFIQSDIYDLPRVLDSKFDIVFTSYGVLCWLPDLTRWGQIIAGYLKKGGVFYIVEGHPIMNMFETGTENVGMEMNYSYFPGNCPTEWAPGYDYAEWNTKIIHGTCEWTHSLSEIQNALIDTGLRIVFLHEFPVCCYRAHPSLKQDAQGWWRLEGDRLPMTFSIKAVKD